MSGKADEKEGTGAGTEDSEPEVSRPTEGVSSVRNKTDSAPPPAGPQDGYALLPDADELDDDDDFKSAADDPTAIWDEDALRAAGLEMPDDAAEEKPKEPPRMGAPRTIAIADDIVPTSPGRRVKQGGLSWPLTFGLAVVVFVVVFTVVKLLQ